MSEQVLERPTEETFDGQATGVESEQVGDYEAEIDHPWDPQQIRVTTKQFSLRNVLDMIKDGDLELAPDFQRNRVWNPGQRSRLIESILLQIPLPAFYFAEDRDGMMRVVDGLQRLSTVQAFAHGEDAGFKLSGLEYLTDLKGKGFGDLNAQWRRRIYNTQIVVHVIDPTTDASVKYDIFKRINTGGAPLNSQEIRHCMSKRRSREFLKRCTHSDAFGSATDGKLRDQIRMTDREMALRFCAFELLGQQAYYEQYRAMDPFLEETTAMLDDNSRVPDAKQEELYERFVRAMDNCHLLFDEHAFRKWPKNVSGRNPFNRPLFETWSVTLAGYEPADLSARKDAIVAHARELMTNDPSYITAITSSTGDPKKVRERFDKTAETAEAGR